MRDRYRCEECGWEGDEDKLDEGCCPECENENLEPIDEEEDEAA